MLFPIKSQGLISDFRNYFWSSSRPSGSPRRKGGSPDHRLAGLIDRMNGENSLGRVEGDALNLGHVDGLLVWLSLQPKHLALDAVGPSTPTMTGGVAHGNEWREVFASF